MEMAFKGTAAAKGGPRLTPSSSSSFSEEGWGHTDGAPISTIPCGCARNVRLELEGAGLHTVSVHKSHGGRGGAGRGRLQVNRMGNAPLVLPQANYALGSQHLADKLHH